MNNEIIFRLHIYCILFLTYFSGDAPSKPLLHQETPLTTLPPFP